MSPIKDHDVDPISGGGERRCAPADHTPNSSCHDDIEDRTRPLLQSVVSTAAAVGPARDPIGFCLTPTCQTRPTGWCCRVDCSYAGVAHGLAALGAQGIAV
eukprot:scaffold2979_cov405-Prasinococcus_capsulatus_cf.AAC.17